jgi:hypothetical protein
MSIDVEHFDLTGRNALVLSAETPAGQAIADAYEEAGARVKRLKTLKADDVWHAVKSAATDLDGLQILASAPDRLLAKPVTAITPDELSEVMLKQGRSESIVLVTHVLGERGLPNSSVYSAAHGAVYNMIRALA